MHGCPYGHSFPISMPLQAPLMLHQANAPLRPQALAFVVTLTTCSLA